MKYNKIEPNKEKEKGKKKRRKEGRRKKEKKRKRIPSHEGKKLKFFLVL